MVRSLSGPPHLQGGFPFGGFGGAESIFEQIFNQDPLYSQMFGRVAVQPIRISFMVRILETEKGPQAGETPIWKLYTISDLDTI